MSFAMLNRMKQLWDYSGHSATMGWFRPFFRQFTMNFVLFYLIICGVHTQGTDTPSVSLSSACLFLAQHPEYQEKAYREQIQIMGDTLRAPTHEEISKKGYLWMIYQETLRHVGVPAVVRQLSSQLSVDAVDLPEGASIYVALHTSNMDPKYWVKTKEFYPDNFLPEYVEKRPKGAFLSFSSGARGCPGKTFAIISSKIILSMLLRRYKFTTSLDFTDMEWEYQLMIESTKGYPVQLTRRAQTAQAA